jgi:hypothetical protein
MSIIGEKFKDYVQAQIEIRQKTHGKGFAADSVRTPQELQILNNQNAWLKLSSSVRVIGNGTDNTSSSTDSVSISAGAQRLIDIGLSDVNNFSGNQLARKAVLFNTLSEVNPAKRNDKGRIVSPGTHNFRSGVATNGSVWNMNSYGLGGNRFGLMPAPGLISAKIDCKNRGSIRSATVEIKCYNKFQFELLELLYLRLGYSMLLEWGWDKYISGEDNSLQTVGNTLCENVWFQDFPSNNFRNVINTIEKYRRRYEGNYDGFLGKVVNFDWNFGANGTFDITLNLITIGDVVESLKVNLPQKMKSVSDIQQITNERANITANLLDTSIVQNAGTSTLAFKLYLDIVETDRSKWDGNSNYLGLFTLLKKSELDLVESIKSPTEGNEGKGVNIDKYNYFLTFGQLLEYIREYVIPSIQNDKMLQIDTNATENICSIFPMQVSLDPRVCFIKPFYLPELSADTRDQATGKTTYIKNWYGWNQAAQDFGITDAKGVMYGQIMNIYLNYNFISDCLQDTTSNNEVFLFKFLSKICEGINSSLGGLTKLEPILEDDNILKIIDQNPIPGIANSAEFGDRFKEQSVPFEIFGYNSTSKGGVTSNFVRDFGLKTNISPDLASMISIGATAQGTKSKNYDGTAFSKWNEGLEDAYAMKYDDPSSNVEINVDTTNIYAPLTAENINTMLAHFNTQEEDKYNLIGWKRSGYKKNTTAGGVTGNSIRDVVSCPVTGQDYQNVSWAGYFSEAKSYLINSKPKEEPVKEAIATNYIQYLAVAFRGSINGVVYNNPNYFQLNEDFINLGKQLFKSFKTAYDNLEYETTKNPSNVIGFLPIDANIKIDGLSGIKIYQQLEVQQGVLPSAYPKAVKFLITKVNHEISDNDWSTSLNTISTPATKESKIPLNNIVSDIIVKNITLGDESNNETSDTKYPELPFISPPPSSNKLSYQNAISILKSITSLGTAKAVFAIMVAEASKYKENGKNAGFNSAGGHNYSGVQTDAGRWGAPGITARYRRNDSERSREFAVFENDTTFLKFMVNRIEKKGINGLDGDKWTTSYINKWWSPSAKKSFTKGTSTYNSKLSIYNSAIKIFNSF